MIRPATSADAPALTDVFQAAYAPAMAQLEDLQDVTAGLAEENVAHPVCVVEECGAVVAGRVLHLANLAVHPDHGGKGLARRLITTAEQAARADGYDTLHLATHVDMPNNVALYTRLGWVEIQRSGNKVMMAKPL